jgi:hypothetical protein
MIVHPILQGLLCGRLRSPGDIAALATGKQAGQQENK